jgi:arabinogalactan endo-1,4-beta-galactosidase
LKQYSFALAHADAAFAKGADGKAIVADLIAKARPVDGGGARGVFYWEPGAYDWTGYPMGAFDRGGKPTAIMDAFLER